MVQHIFARVIGVNMILVEKWDSLTPPKNGASLKDNQRFCIQGSRVIPNNKRADSGKTFDSISEGSSGDQDKSHFLSSSIGTDGPMALSCQKGRM
jgi:hypothetical protein